VQELRLALRRLRRRPGRGLAGALTVGIGIGATTSAFAAVDAVLLQPLPVERQDELVVAWQLHSDRGALRVPFRADAYDAVVRGAESLSAAAGVTAWGAQPVPVEEGDDAYVLRHASVAGDFFGVLGTRASLGRLLTREDDAPGAPPTAVLSHGAWRSRYGADPDVVGSTRVVDGAVTTLVGVAPEGFDFPRGTDLWQPLRMDYAGDPGIVELHVVGRRAAGVAAATVAEDVTATLRERGLAPTTGTAATTVVTRLEEHLVGGVEPVVRAAMVAALVLLLVAIANLALLLLAGGRSAAQEVAVRRALGAERSRLVGRLLADASVVALLGIGAGVVVARVALRVLVPLVPPELPRLDAAALDGRAVAVATLLGIASAVISAVVTGGALSRWGIPRLLTQGGRAGSSGSSRLRRSVAALQVSLTVVSAVGAGLLVRTVAAMNRVDHGMATQDMTAISLRVPYGWFEVPERYFAALEEVVRDLESVPGIIAARPSLGPPLEQRLEAVLRAEGQGDEEAERNPYVAIDAVLPGHLEAMGIALRAGRDLTELDNRADADPVVVVDEPLARALWPGEDPIGRRMTGFTREPTLFTVVGVAGATRYRELLEPHPRAYFPLRRLRGAPPSALLVRGSPDASIGDLVRGAFERVDPRVRVMDVRPMAQALREPTAGRRFAAGVLVLFAAATTLLAGLGVYGVFTVTVQERMRELGVRRALGAQRLDLVRLVLGGIMSVVAVGATAGLVVAIWAGRLVESLLYGVVPADPATLTAVLVGILALAAAGGLAPAVRAAAVDPAESLRSE
jgi:putative ABC transport system permease protein